MFQTVKGTLRRTHKHRRAAYKSRETMAALLFLMAVVGMLTITSIRTGYFGWYLGIYGTLNVVYLLGKMGLAKVYKPRRGAVPNFKVSVVIPAFNEQPDAVVGTVKSILQQDYPIHEIFYVDDGSQETSGFEAVQALSEQLSNQPGAPKVIAHRLERNMGKRHAQIWAFKRATGDVFVTVDSDCDLLPNAISQLLIPLRDKKVLATTGHVNARNRNDNLLTKLIDMRYENAFRVERAAQSVTGNVLVCSGPLSCYRREVIDENIEHYGSQTFLGKPVQFGDDRCLTNYAIAKGKTVYQSTAKCVTDVPTSMRKFLKQQTRWNKSFFRESLESLKLGLSKPNVMVWVVLELATWLVFGVMLVIGLFIKPFTVGAIIAVYYLGYIILSAYARNVYYAIRHPLSFLLAPVYGLIHIFLLLPLRFYALATIRVTKWGTR